jgi:uncharacterized membrane protein YccC
MRVPGWLAEAWDRIVASDPGLSRLRMAGAAAVSMASALGVEYGFATFTHAGPMGTIVAMLLGAVMSMMGSMALGGPGVWPKVRTAAFFPVAIGIGLVAGVAVGPHTDLMLGVFVLVMFAAVAVRRFGVPFFFYGFMTWMGYFFAAFLHATLAMLPGLLASVVVATVWVLLLSVTVLRTNTTRTLRRTIGAFDARARSVARACASLLEAREGDRRQRDRMLRRLQARQAGLVEAGLIIEAWSAEPGALPPDRSAPVLRRRLIDAQQTLDRMVGAAVALCDGDPTLMRAAATIADRLAVHDDTGADRAGYALAETVERSAAVAAPQRPDGWLPARHFATAALEFVALSQEVRARQARPTAAEADLIDEFEPAVGLAMGYLPGSPAAAKDVPARGRRWNPLARLDLTTRQAVQVALAGGLAILLGRELSATRYYWAVIAAFIMFTGTATRAETFLKGLNRVAGTLVGLFASVWLAEVTAGRTAAALVVVVASMFCGFYLIRVSYAYMIFFITIMVGQLYSVLHEFSTGLLVLRLEETAIGAAAGFLVAFLVTPLSTRDAARAARDSLLTALADLLNTAADRLTDTARPDLDALTRALEDRLRQLTMVARPLTRPLVWGNSPPRTRHRLALYAATTTHARGLAVALRRPPSGDTIDLATACRALATAATRLTGIKPGQPQPTVAEPLAQADALLFILAPAAPGARATDPVINPLIRLQYLLGSIAVVPTTDQPAAPDPDRHGAELAGTVTDPDGEPLHARIVLIAEGTTRKQAAAYSDATGRYRISDCPPGRYLVLATAGSHYPAATAVTLATERPTRTDFTLTAAVPPHGSLRGTVQARDDNRPLAGATITLLDERGDVVRTARTDTAGQYEVPAIATGNYTLVAAGLPPTCTTANLTVGRDHTLDLVLRDDTELRGGQRPGDR